MSKKTNTSVPSTSATATKTGVAKTNKPALEPRSNIANVGEPTQVCKTNLTHKKNLKLALTSANFSPLQSGGFRTMCKKCQVIVSKQWTDKVAPMRVVQARARQLTGMGIPVAPPLAKGFDMATALPLMTIEHWTRANGEISLTKISGKGVTFHPSVNAEGEYQKLVDIRTATRDQKKADAEATAKLEKDQRDAERQKKRDKREADNAKAQAKVTKEREAAKAKRDRERAAQAKIDAKVKADAKKLREKNRKEKIAQDARDKKANAKIREDARKQKTATAAASVTAKTSTKKTSTVKTSQAKGLAALSNASKNKTVKAVAEPVIEPAIEPVIEPVVEPVIEPAVEPVVEAEVETATEPVVESVETVEAEVETADTATA